VKNIGLNLRLQLYFFSNCNINPNPEHFPKHHALSPNHEFSQHIFYVERCSVHAHIARSQKFRLTVVIQPRTTLFFINQRCAKCVCLYHGLRVCGQKYIVIICNRLRKFVPRLNKHDDVIDWNFMKIAPPRIEELVAPLFDALLFSLCVLCWHWHYFWYSTCAP